MEQSTNLETKELILRHIDKQDRDDFVNLITLPAFGRLSPFGSLTTEGADSVLNRIIQSYSSKNQGSGFWTVINKKDNSYAGFVGYQPIVFEQTSVEMFFIGFNRRFWGTQLPLAAAEAVNHYAFTLGNIKQFIVFIHPEDVESIYIAQNLKYNYEKECLFFDATVLLFSFTADQ